MPKEKYEAPNQRRVYTVMTPEDLANNKESVWTGLELSGGIRNLSYPVFKLTHLTTLYLNKNQLLSVPPEIAKLNNLTYLDLSYNKISYLPAEMGEMVQLRELLLHFNNLRYVPNEIGKLFQLITLTLHGNPLSPEIRAVVNDPNKQHVDILLSNLLENLTVTTSQPPQRPWIQISPGIDNKPMANYTVMCYNVLCEKYATRTLYGYCPQWALTWEYRRKGIIEEIRHYNADVITLQEVETDQFHTFFKVELQKDGYEGIFAAKSRAKTMYGDDKKQVDGCAIFYRTSKFGLVKEHLIEFNQVAMSQADGSHEMLNRVMPKDNIALAAVLETKAGTWVNGTPPESQVSQHILVTTFHVHWDPEFSDVKLVQTVMLMSEIKRIMAAHCLSLRPGAVTDPASIPLLLCGDLNSLPESGVLEYLNEGRVASNHSDFKSLVYDKCLEKICTVVNNTTDQHTFYTHPFNLGQGYSKDIMPYTNYTYDFKGIIDYIFHSTDYIRPLGVLGPLDHNWFIDNKVIGCPHPHIPSDHMPLIVEFEMKSQYDREPLGATASSNQRMMDSNRSSTETPQQGGNSAPSSTGGHNNQQRR